MFGEYLHESVFDKSAAYLFHIISNDAFVDGNKRTGAAVSLIFLHQNDCEIQYDMQKFEEMVVQVAKGQCSKEEISLFLQDAS